MEVKGSSALVTGAGRGIGRAIALALAGEGAAVTAVSRTAAELDTLAAEVRARGGAVLTHVADLRRPEAAARVVEAARAHGRLQILVNNAAVGGLAPVAETSDEQWDDVLATNLSAVFRLTRAALPQLTEGGGHVVMISSLVAHNPAAGMAAYGASKAALDYFASCLMMEVRHHGVKVSTIAPGSVATTFGRGGFGGEDSWKLTADDVAAVLVDLLRARHDALASRVDLRPLRPRSR